VFTLASLGCPIDSTLFDDLRAAESRLGPKELIWKETTVGAATLNLGGGTHRDGFEILRDIITGHRRAWGQRYLSEYLQARWRGELQAASREYSRFAADKTKPPTPKQFAKIARPPAAHWFGGDITGVYAALGLKCPLQPPTYSRILPHDWRGFVGQVFVELGGDLPKPEDRDERPEQNASRYALDRLAGQSLDWVQVSEALTRQPELSEFGQRRFEGYGSYLADDVNEAWRSYCSAIERALSVFDTRLGGTR
jgi:hypothetical protein